MSTTPPPPQLPPPALLNALATSGTNSVDNGGDHSQSWIQSLKPSILIIILILSITVLVSVSLCFLLRHLNRRCIRHFTTTASASSSTASNRRISPELSPAFSIIDSLPLFTFSSITRRSSSNVTAAAASGGGDCAVCLSKFEGHDQLRLLPLCCHAFHAECIDTWLRSNETTANQTCPLCRSPIQVSDADVMKSLLTSTTTNGRDSGGDSFRLEIGSISRRQGPTLDSIESAASSYSMGSFDYIVEGESEITANQVQRGSISNKEDTADPEQSLVSEVGSGRSWLKDYVDRLSNSLSSRTLSFRSSGRFFTGSSRRSEAAGNIEWDMEANRVGEEISELFRWFSGV